MRRSIFPWLATLALVAAGSLPSAAGAGVSSSKADHVQEGDNSGRHRQGGSDVSGDAVGGQVSGVASSGTTSVDARNESVDVIIASGDASGSNGGTSVTGHDGCDQALQTGDINNVGPSCTIQQGNNTSAVRQNASSTSGVALGGQIVGVTTSPGASADVVAGNLSVSSVINTGDARAANAIRSFVGLRDGPALSRTADVRNIIRSDIAQEGDNRLFARQAADSVSGAGTGGQVLAVASAGRASVDATNETRGASVSSGDSVASDDASVFAGLNRSSDLSPLADLNGLVVALEAQQGNNTAELFQTAGPTSGTALAGQVSGIVVSAGGSADVVLANTGVNSHAASGNTTLDNSSTLHAGLDASTLRQITFSTGVPD